LYGKYKTDLTDITKKISKNSLPVKIKRNISLNKGTVHMAQINRIEIREKTLHQVFF